MIAVQHWRISRECAKASNDRALTTTKENARATSSQARLKISFGRKETTTNRMRVACRRLRLYRVANWSGTPPTVRAAWVGTGGIVYLKACEVRFHAFFDYVLIRAVKSLSMGPEDPGSGRLEPRLSTYTQTVHIYTLKRNTRTWVSGRGVRWPP